MVINHVLEESNPVSLFTPGVEFGCDVRDVIYEVCSVLAPLQLLYQRCACVSLSLSECVRVCVCVCVREKHKELRDIAQYGCCSPLCR